MEASRKTRRVNAGLWSSEIFRYLVCGGAATLIALGSRIVLSQWMPFAFATLGAQAISLVAGYWLYRSFVWRSTTRSIGSTIIPFIAVNLLSVAVVMLVSVAVRVLLIRLFGPSEIVDTLAHATGIVSGAGVSMVGHRTFTFRTR
jgi:energy-coupling factor transport system substrate-specific component